MPMRSSKKKKKKEIGEIKGNSLHSFWGIIEFLGKT
jgi:hypothetical protein